MFDDDTAAWLTSVRLHRLATILGSLPPSRDAWSSDEATRVLYRRCGGPVPEINALLFVLTSLSLLENRDGRVFLTRLGETVARPTRKGDLKPFGLLLIRSGSFALQAEKLISVGHLSQNGDLACTRKLARTVAPQLLALLAWWKLPDEGSEIVVPVELLAELSAVWALLPPPSVPTWAIERKQVGDRAEMYTVQFERSKTNDPTMIHWVALETDSLGWDVEDHGASPQRNIEVKGSRGREVVFNLSRNEWEKAHELKDQYELQFWGGIDLTRDLMNEYTDLRSEGYPRCYPNLAAQLSLPGWKSTPTNWRVVNENA